MDWLSMLGTLVGILTFVFGAFHYVVLKPLQESIIALNGLINEIKESVKENEKVRHGLEIKVATLEQKIQAVDAKFGLIMKLHTDSQSEQLSPLVNKLNDLD